MSAAIAEQLLTQALAQVDKAGTVTELEAIRVAFLGKKGQLTEQLKTLGKLPPKERSAFGQALNQTKVSLQQHLGEKIATLEKAEQNKQLAEQAVDVTLPGNGPGKGGSLHPVTHTQRRLEDIFISLGFSIETGPEIEDDYHNFSALNIPLYHPARAMHDTFYIKPPKGAKRNLLLRTHTSPVQIRAMKRHTPPLRMITPGRVYRCDSDTTHTPMFHQLEGLVVDEQATLGELKALVQCFLASFFGRELECRFRPSYFPFTEPSMEVDMQCVFCDGKSPDCRVCSGTGWLEIMGCGMVHPHVLAEGGIDAEHYSGYAFGLGIDRLAMLRYGIHDLRLFFENDLSFLEQF